MRSVLRATLNRAATSVAVSPSAITARTGLIPLLSHRDVPRERECHRSAEVGVKHQPKQYNRRVGLSDFG
jgi:hypothetical protein